MTKTIATKMLVCAALLLSGMAAHAETMTCTVSVLQAGELARGEDSGVPPVTTVPIPLKDNEGETEATVNSEKVYFWVNRRDHADVYDLSILLLTPEADRIPQAKFVVIMSNLLINDGPTHPDMWHPGVEDGSTLYTPYLYDAGALVLTPKVRKALEKAKMWGTHPFNSNLIAYQHVTALFEASAQLIKDGLLKETDVVGLAQLFGCIKK